MANLDAFTSERVLNGEANLPELSDFIDALRAPSHSSELTMERAVVDKMIENLKGPASPPVLGRNRKTGRRFTRRVAVGAAAAVLSLGGVAAAATGVNPLAPIIGGSPDPSLESVPETVPETTQGAPSSTVAASRQAATSTTAATSESSASPTSIECVDGNHGKTVSSVAQNAPRGKPETPGKPESGATNHGSVVREAAQSDCGKEAAAEASKETEDSKEDDTAVTTTRSKPSTTGATTTVPGKSDASNGKGAGAKGNEK